MTAGEIDVSVSIGTGTGNVSVTFEAAAVVAGAGVLYEFLVDGTAGDANGDGTTHADEDEFVEFVNISGVELDFEGAQLFESDIVAQARFTFEAGTVQPGEAVVIFGGGSPAAAPAGSQFFAGPDNPFYLSLDSPGDIINLLDAGGSSILSVGYGDEVGGAPNANIDEAITLDPQITGSFYEPHSDVGTGLFSPGTLADGSSF